MKIFNSRNKGFTLVELLVVVAIIGLLATVILVNVNTTRGKAKNTAIKSSLLSVSRAAGILSLNQNSYSGLCSGSDVSRASSSIGAQGGTFECRVGVSNTAWYVFSNLVGGGTWCVDSTGNNKASTATTAAYACQ
jgi:prepilin-type N-terminal cleavage/methylation domain-containing protein